MPKFITLGLFISENQAIVRKIQHFSELARLVGQLLKSTAVTTYITDKWFEKIKHKQESLANAEVSSQQPCWSKTEFDMK